MTVALKGVILRLLDDWTVRPVGGAGAEVDVFLVSATIATLDRAITEGRFRPDLLYRLNTLEVMLPRLRDRADFDAIARHLLRKIDPDCRVTAEALARLAPHPWPGNIRELRNMLARLTLGRADGGIAPRRATGPHPHGVYRDDRKHQRDRKTPRRLKKYDLSRTRTKRAKIDPPSHRRARFQGSNSKDSNSKASIPRLQFQGLHQSSSAPPPKAGPAVGS